MAELNENTIKTELLNKLDYISDNFMESAVKNSLLVIGSASSTFEDVTSVNDTTMSENNPLGYLANTVLGGYTMFASRYGASITGTNETSVRIRDTTLPNSVYTEPAANDTTITSAKEINMSKFVAPNSKLMNHMNAVRRLYSLLDPKNYKTYVNLVKTNDTSKNNLKIVQYELDSNFKTQYVVVDNVTGTNNLNDMKKLVVSLRGGIPLTTSDLVIASNASLTISAFPINTPTLKFRYGVREDTVVQLVPGTTSGPSSDINIMASNRTDMYITVSMMARVRQEGTDPTVGTATLTLDIENSTDTEVRNVEKSFELTRQWERIMITRRVPAGKNCKLRIKSTTPILFSEVQTEVRADSVSEGTYASPVFQRETNLFVLRRLLYLYELMANFYIAVNVMLKYYNAQLPSYTAADRDAEKAAALTAYNAINNDTTKTQTEKDTAKTTYDAAVAEADRKYTTDQSNRGKRATMSNVVNLNYSALKYFNENMISSSTSNPNAITRLTKVMNNRANAFKKTSQDITVMDTQLMEGKQTLKTRVESVHSQQKQNQKVKLFMLVSLVMLIAIGGAGAIAIMAPLEEKQRTILALGVVCGGIVVSTLLNLVYNTNVEGFQGVALVNPNNLALGTAESNLANTAGNATIWILSQASLYLSNTIYLALTLQSYATYGNINHTLNKEKNYYVNRLDTLERTNVRVGELGNLSRLEKNNNRSKMVYFIFLMVVVSITAGLLVFTRDMSGMKNVVLIGAGVILLIGTMMFIIDTSGRVRTKGDQYYWGKPSTEGL